MLNRKIHRHATHIPQRGTHADIAQPAQAAAAVSAQLPQTQTPAAVAYLDVQETLHLANDRNYDLSSFRHTWQEPEFTRLIQQLSQQTAAKETVALERRCLQMLGDLFHTAEPAGASVSSRAQAVQLAGLAMLWNWRRHHRTPGRPITRPNIIWGRTPSPAWAHFARIFEIETRSAETTDERFMLDVDSALARIDANTIGVVGVLGNDVTGNYDSLAELNAGLTHIYNTTGRDVPIHVDAAGGFVAPFLTPELPWDFRLPRVQSIHVSGGQYGMVQPTAEWVLWRDPATLPAGLSNTNHDDNAASAPERVMAQYYSFLRLGRDGYTRIMQDLQDVSQIVAQGLAATNRFELLSDGHSLPLVCAKLRDGSRFSVLDVSQELHDRGWRVPASRVGSGPVEILRIVPGEGFDRSRAEMLVQDFRRVLKVLDIRPPRRSRQEIEQSLLHDVSETLHDLRGIHTRIPLTTPARVS